MKLQNAISHGLVLAFFVFIFSSLAAKAESINTKSQLSIGGMYGSNLGAVATYNYNSKIFVDAAGSMEFDGDQNVFAWGDILVRQGRLFGVMGNSVNWYWGGGVKFRSENDPNVEQAYYLGPRGAIGLSSQIGRNPIEVFTEASYSYYLVEASDTEMDINIGARYYF